MRASCLRRGAGPRVQNNPDPGRDLRTRTVDVRVTLVVDVDESTAGDLEPLLFLRLHEVGDEDLDAPRYESGQAPGVVAVHGEDVAEVDGDVLTLVQKESVQLVVAEGYGRGTPTTPVPPRSLHPTPHGQWDGRSGVSGVVSVGVAEAGVPEAQVAQVYQP